MEGEDGGRVEGEDKVGWREETEVGCMEGGDGGRVYGGRIGVVKADPKLAHYVIASV